MNYKSKLHFFSLHRYYGVIHSKWIKLFFFFFNREIFEFFCYFLNSRLFRRNAYRKMLMVKEKIIRQLWKGSVCRWWWPSCSRAWPPNRSTSVFTGPLHLLMSHLLQLHSPTLEPSSSFGSVLFFPTDRLFVVCFFRVFVLVCSTVVVCSAF